MAGRPKKPDADRRAGTVAIAATQGDLDRLDSLAAILPGSTRHGIAREAMRIGLAEIEGRFKGKK